MRGLPARGRVVWGLVALLLPSLFGCGPVDTLTTFDVELVTFSDCTQVSLGVTCEDEGTVREIVREGRWTFDDRGSSFFVLTTEDGKSLTGIRFPDDGQVTTEACTGQGGGGECFFGRTRQDGIDPDTGCAITAQFQTDILIKDETLSAITADVVATEEDCEDVFISQVLVEVRGTLAENDVLARERGVP